MAKKVVKLSELPAINVTAGTSKTAKLPRYTVKVLASNGKWRAAYENSLQACFALVDGLLCDYRIVADNEILLAQSGGSLVTLSKLCGKPLRDYRYLQGKKIAKQLPTVCDLHIKLFLDLQQFPRRASTVQAPTVKQAPAELPTVQAPTQFFLSAFRLR